MKTLEQVKPRTDVATLPGNSVYNYIISEPGSYYLSCNVTVSRGVNGIHINSTDVTLDLNGFNMSRISGSGGSCIHAAQS